MANPVKGVANIAFTINSQAHVTLKVYDSRGRRVRALVDEPQAAGTYRVQWDGRNDAGRAAASGIYFCRLEAAGATRTKKMVLVR